MLEIKNNMPDPKECYREVEEEAKTVYGGKEVIFKCICKEHIPTGEKFTSHYYNMLNAQRIKKAYNEL